MRMLSLFALLLMVLVFSGCSSYRDRGDLSRAMESSASGGGGKHGGGSSEKSDLEESVWGLFGGIFSTSADEYSMNVVERTDGGGTSRARDESEEAPAVIERDWEEDYWHIPMDVAYLIPLGGNINSITRISISPVGSEDRLNYGGLHLGAGWVDFKSGSLPDRAVDHAGIFEIGLSYRRYLNGPHVFFSPYFAANAGWQPMFWRYRNPIVSDGESIGSDWIHGINGYGGAGVAMRRSRILTIFGEVGIGGTLYPGNTQKGFRNDVFDNFGYIGFKAGVTMSF